MTKNERKELQYKVLCEKVVNESGAEVEKHLLEIVQALNKEKLNKKDILFLKIAARVFVQKTLLGRVEDMELLEKDLSIFSLCGQSPSCEECEREVCLLDVS